MDKMAISPDTIARAIAFAIEQPPDVDVNSPALFQRAGSQPEGRGLERSNH
jgi:NADP-dependent 3-hydroxy acid dehydrogenase YdfG